MKGSFIPLVQIDIGLLANQVGISATDTLDAGQGVHDLLLSIDVGVEKTQNELDCQIYQLWWFEAIRRHLRLTVRLFAADESWTLLAKKPWSGR